MKARVQFAFPVPQAPPRSHLIYRLFDSAGRLLYIGRTTGLRDRLVHHSSQQPWWDRVAGCAIEAHSSHEVAVWAEWAAIATEQSEFNRLPRRPTPSIPQSALTEAKGRDGLTPSERIFMMSGRLS